MATPSARPLVQLCPSGGNVYRPSFESVLGVKNPSNRSPQNDYLNLLSHYVDEVEDFMLDQRLTHFVCAQNLKNVSICGMSIFGERLAMGNLNLEGFRFNMFINKSKLQLKTQYSYDISIITVIQLRCD